MMRLKPTPVLAVSVVLAMVASGLLAGGAWATASSGGPGSGAGAPAVVSSTISPSSNARPALLGGLAIPTEVPVPREAPGKVGLVPAPYLGAAPIGRPGPAPLSARASANPANPTLDQLSAAASVAAVGPSNQTALVGIIDETLLVTGSGQFFNDGYSAAFRTTDGGSSWTEGWVGPNASWSISSNPAYGDVTWGADSVAGANGTALYAAIYAQPCAVFAAPPCNSTLEYGAPSGVSVARSTNGGASFDAPQPIDSVAEWRLTNITCSGTPYSYYIPANISDKPSVAVALDGRVAAVGWDVVDYNDALVCETSGLGLAINGVSDYSQVSVSTNGGASWSAPRTIGAGVSGPASVGIGPSPADAIFFVYQDSQNGTSTTFPYAVSVSTDLGARWSAPVDIGARTMVHPVEGTASDEPWATASLPNLAVDSNSSSPYAGTAYLAWEDNRSGAVGSPSIAVVSGEASGGWSGTSYLTPAGGDERYFEPSVAVDPSGRVYVVYYAVNLSSGAYQLEGQSSSDAGTSWSAPFAVATNASLPASSVTWIGYWTGAAATSAGLYAGWTDCSSATCESEDDPAVDAAHAVPVSISANLPAVRATSVSGGVTTVGTVPVATAWDLGALVSASVPAWVDLENTSQYVGVFESFSGLISSTITPVELDFEGGSSLVATYGFSPVGWVAGSVSPANSAPTVTVDSEAVGLSPGPGGVDTFNVSLLPGAVYWVNASAIGYSPYSTQVPVGLGTTSSVTIVLHRLTGWISGRLTPVNATLTVNGTTVTSVDPTTGLFNVTVGWGAYWVNATSYGLTNFSKEVSVTIDRTTSVSPTLLGSWLTGTISPASANLTIDGSVVLVASGTFNVSLYGGTHTVAASAPGYAPYLEPVTTVAGRGTYLSVVMTDLGWIAGTIAPPTATVSVDGNRIAVIGGEFNFSVTGDAVYNVSASAAGFVPAWSNVRVTPARVSPVQFSLEALPTSCVSGCASSNGTSNATRVAGAPISYADVGIAAGAILGAAVVIAVVLGYRDRRPPRGEGLYAAPDSAPEPSGSSAPPPGPP